MRRILCFLILGLPLVSLAQIVSFDKGIPDEHPSYFNGEFLRNNKIKSIVAEVSIKREMQPITSKGTVVQYQFDRQGRLTEKLNTFKKPGGEIDTSAEAYAYNSLDRLITRSSYERSGYSSIQYDYDTGGQVVSQNYFRGPNTTVFRYKVEKGASTLVKTENFRHEEVNDSTHRKIFLNNQGIPFKRMTTTSNSFGTFSSEETIYLSVNKGSITRFKYDLEGRLQEIVKTENLFKTKIIKFTYAYDEMGNIMSEKKYVNGKLVRSREFVYEVESLRLKAELSKDEEMNVITIYRYRYEYY